MPIIIILVVNTISHAYSTNIELIATSYYTRVSFRIFVKGGGANATIAELRGARTIVILQMFFNYQLRNIIELFGFLKLGGSGGIL